MGEEVGKDTVLAVADPAHQESLVTENEPDGMDAEQTWPTEEEMMEAEREHKEKNKRVIKVRQAFLCVVKSGGKRMHSPI